MTTATLLPTERKRIVSIDRFRGLLVFAMILFQAMERFESLGVFSRIADHAPSENAIYILPTMAIADVVAPAFFMMISLNFLPSFGRRVERDGKAKTYLHFVIRFLAIIGFGCAKCAIEDTFDAEDAYPVWIRTFLFALTMVVLVAAIAALVCSFIKKAEKIGKIAGRVMTLLLAFLGVCCFVMSVYDVYFEFWKYDDFFHYWDTLPAIGGAGLFLLLFAECNTAIRAVAGTLSLALYHFIYAQPGNFDELLDIPVQGGVVAILSWGGMCLLFTVLADLWYADRAAREAGKFSYRYLIGLGVATVVGVIAALTLPVLKGPVSLGYVLVSVPVSGWLFYLVSLTDKWEPKVRFLSWWGASPILMFLLQYLFVEVPCALIGSLEDAGVFGALLFCLVVCALVTLIGYLLYKNKKAIRF